MTSRIIIRKNNGREYVKEYGEGVDRMCKELESVGLPDPVFNNSTFILKTVVLSSSYKNASIQQNDASIERNDAMIDNKDTMVALILRLGADKKISKKDADDAQKVVNEIDVMQVIGAADIMKILNCKTTKARQVFKVM
ncbi:MAG: hypothetical protein IJ675_05565 [Pseudobutyrivibrio sp.]|nr:hypothetical protein [Pseudobutyrivibrio sp.]